jgi:Global regulator protein family
MRHEQEDLGSANRVQRHPQAGGLVLTRSQGEGIKIGDVIVTLDEVRPGRVKLRIKGPRQIPVSRVDNP